MRQRMRAVLLISSVLLGALLVPTAARADADADLDAQPPITVAGSEFRFVDADGGSRLDRRDATGWTALATAPSGARDLLVFGEAIYAIAGDAGGGRLLRLGGGTLGPVDAAPTGVDDAFAFAGRLYVTGAAGWWSSTDGTTWTALPDAPTRTSEPVEYAGALYLDARPQGATTPRFTRFDGATFTTIPDGPTALITAVAADGKLYFRDAGQEDPYALFSFDGSTFTRLTDPPFTAATAGPVLVHGHVYYRSASFGRTAELIRIDGATRQQLDVDTTDVTRLQAAGDTLWYFDSGASTGAPAQWRTWREPTPAPDGATVRISGPAVVDGRLAATAAGWPAGTTFTWAWRRDGVLIRGAALPTYRLQAADLGHWISVAVTGTNAAYAPASAVRTATLSTWPAAAVFTRTQRPIVSGTMRKGSLLRVITPTWTPAADTVRFQWRRNGVNIAGANGPTYRLRSADRGRVITVRTTGGRPGYDSRTTESAGRRTAR